MAKKAKVTLLEKRRKTEKRTTRLYNRCSVCGRKRAYMRKFGLCRICFREHANRAELPGVRKASW